MAGFSQKFKKKKKKTNINISIKKVISQAFLYHSQGKIN